MKYSDVSTENCDGNDQNFIASVNFFIFQNVTPFNEHKRQQRLRKVSFHLKKYFDTECKFVSHLLSDFTAMFKNFYGSSKSI